MRSSQVRNVTSGEELRRNGGVVRVYANSIILKGGESARCTGNPTGGWRLEKAWNRIHHENETK